jgi:hypothetical protein
MPDRSAASFDNPITSPSWFATSVASRAGDGDLKQLI